MLAYKGYLGTVEADEGAFVGRVSGLRDVITFEGATFAEVEQAFRDSVDDYLVFCAERGEKPDRTFSGRIPLRLDPDLHRRAVAQADAEGVSLNQWIASRIETAA
jgi:predicted HicB family RNase H-like nuclease